MVIQMNQIELTKPFMIFSIEKTLWSPWFIQKNSALEGFINCCTSGNIHKVVIFVNLARRTNSRMQESHENYYYNSATKDLIFVKSTKIGNSRIFKRMKINRSTVLHAFTSYIFGSNIIYFSKGLKPA